MDDVVTVQSHLRQNRLVVLAAFALGMILLGGGLALWWLKGDGVFTAMVSAALAWCF